MIGAWLLAFALPVHAETPKAAVTRVMARAETLIASEAGKDAREIADKDREAEGLSKELRPLGWKAAPALAAVAQDLKRPPKVRLLATSFLALIRDPAAFPALEDILLNKEQTPYVRSLAALSLPGLGAPDALVRAALCAALDQEDLPREVLSDALIPTERLGCPSPAALVRVARSFGPRPSDKDMGLAVAAIKALGASRGVASGKAVLGLIGYFPPLGLPRAAAIVALDARRAEFANWLAPETLPVVTEALRSETDHWETMRPLIRVAVALGPDAAPALTRLASHPDAEVLADAAEALVVFKRVEALPALEGVIKGAMNDPRFSPKEGRPDPAALLARIEKSADALRRAR